MIFFDIWRRGEESTKRERETETETTLHSVNTSCTVLIFITTRAGKKQNKAGKREIRRKRNLHTGVPIPSCIKNPWTTHVVSLPALNATPSVPLGIGHVDANCQDAVNISDILIAQSNRL